MSKECRAGQQFLLKCFLCGKSGHMRRYCSMNKTEEGIGSAPVKQASKVTGVTSKPSSSRGDFVMVRGANGQKKGKILKSEVGSYRSYMAEVGVLSQIPDEDENECEEEIVLNEDEDEYHEQVLALVAKRGEGASSDDEREW